MGSFTVEIKHFSGTFQRLNALSPLTLNTRLIDVCHESVMIGYLSYQAALQADKYEAKRREYTIKSVLEVRKGIFCVRPTYRNRDATDKANISYMVGMAFASLIARHLLNVTHVLHLKNNLGYTAVTKKPGRIPRKRFVANKPVKNTGRQPDLIGTDTANGVHILEAKGSTSKMNWASFQKAIDQVSQVRTVNNQPPITKVAVYTKALNKYVHSFFYDPEPEELDSGLELTIDREVLLRQYYTLFFDEVWFTMPTWESNGQFYHLSPLSITEFIGIRADVLRALHEGTLAHFFESERLEDHTFFDEEMSTSIRSDGTVLRWYGSPDEPNPLLPFNPSTMPPSMKSFFTHFQGGSSPISFKEMLNISKTAQMGTYTVSTEVVYQELLRRMRLSFSQQSHSHKTDNEEQTD